MIKQSVPNNRFDLQDVQVVWVVLQVKQSAWHGCATPDIFE